MQPFLCFRQYLLKYLNVRAQLVTGLGSGLIGIFYVLAWFFEEHLFISNLFSYIFILFLYILYVYIKETIRYNILDTIIFVLANNVRALKSIIAAVESIMQRKRADNENSTETQKNTKTEKKPQKMQALSIFSFYGIQHRLFFLIPNGTCKHIPFDRQLEEIISKMIFISLIFEVINSRKNMSMYLLMKNIFTYLFFYITREIEAALTGTQPPGYLTYRMRRYYICFMYLALCSELELHF